QAAERLFGFTAAEALGQPLSIIVPAERNEEVAGVLQRLLQGERLQNYETVRRHQDGHLIEVSVTVSPILDGAGVVIGASGIVRDIGDRRRTEHVLRSTIAALDAEHARAQQ